MTVTQVHQALGSWDINLRQTLPADVWDALDYFGHIAFVPGRVDPAQHGDNLLTVARYVGVVRRRDNSGDDRRTNLIEQGFQLAGVGMEFWLGDDDDKGAVYETAVVPTAKTFAQTVAMLLPPSVTAGTLYPVPGVYSGRHQYETPRKALKYVCDTFTGSSGQKIGYRVNGDATLDAGPETDLYVTEPRCVISRKTAGKDTSDLESVPGTFAVARDVEDFSTRVVLLAEGDGESIATGTASIGPGLNPYLDLHGNPLKLTRMASESDTTATMADTRAALLLAQYTTSQDELTIETDNYYIEGSFDVGDYVWVWDPGAGLVNPANEITFRGERLNPIKLQVTEARWPITEGYTVAYRAGDGTWYDLTDHMEWDGSHTVYVTVGGFTRALEGSGAQPIGSRPSQDTSVPAAPTLVTPFTGSAYLDARGFTRARVILAWTAPNNTDGTTIIDGDHYEVRYAVDTDMIYPATWSQLSQVRWQDLQTWAQPFASPTGQWQTMYVPWGAASAQLQDLSPGVGYDVQIRAVDKVGNRGAWSPLVTFVASQDNIPPSTPAAPEVAGSRIALQITHRLGQSSGGTFNLESDLHHLEVHVDYEPGFTPDATTLKAKVSATAGMIQAQIPVVATVQVEETTARYVRVIAVDQTGNKSGPSDAVQATALLIDNAHISDLTVSKLTAGTLGADVIVGARIKTADTGSRVELNSGGIGAWNAAGQQTVAIAAADGSVSIIGQLKSGTSGRRIEINPTDTLAPEIRWYADTGSRFGYINAISDGTEVSLGMNSSSYDDGTGTQIISRAFLTDQFARLEIIRAADLVQHGGYTHAHADYLLSGFTRNGVEGGRYSAGQNHVDIGYHGPTNENYLYFDDSGLTFQKGRWVSDAAAYGQVTVTPVPNTPTPVTLTGFVTKGTDVYGFATASTTVIGSTVQGVSVSGVTNSTMTIWVYRTNNTATNVNWQHIGYA
ncbi:hypothetical protein ACFWPV_09785 [Streptomyces uncialis]|uniref:hypothetical protein n=1 Tax=Streptomyces uncialis TaxID=1048205 RepID=UPI00364D7A6C